MPKSLHETGSVSEARGRKAFTRYTNGGSDPVLIAQVNGSRINFFLQNLGAAAIYIGDAAVTANTGIQVASGADFEDDDSYDAWYYTPNGVVSDVRVVITVTDT